jgi:polyferredoxin
MTVKTVRNLRRLSQILFFAVFFWLILKTTFEVSFTPNTAEAIRLPYPVSMALEFDPLVALMTLLSSGTVYHGLLWSLVILIPTIFLGRFFCGWVCPLGSLNHWTSEFGSERNFRKGTRRIESNRYKGYQRIKYYVLFVLLGAAFAGSLQAGLLDPLPLLARSIGTFLLPSIHSVADGVLGVCKDTGWPPLMSSAQFVYDILAAVLLPFRQAHFNAILSVGILFLLIIALNRVITRFWCRGICPLGAMLGLFSRFSLFGLQKDQATCNHCNICLLTCQGADNPDVGAKWRQAECHLCLNCQASCPQGSLSFRFYPSHATTKENPAPTQKIDVTRRTVLTSVAAGLGTWALFRAGSDFEVNANPLTIRPPGSLAEAQFIEKCIRCGQCMRVCPNNALHPTLLEAGAEAMWTPILIAKIGYCEPTCTLCGQVCPTGAIAELTLTQKVGDKTTPANRIGTAFIDRGRCLPWAMATPCIVCEEWCPTSPKAVYLKDETVFNSVGLPVQVKQPYVDPHYCTGCGACEYACPVSDQKAIRITSVGESRSERNQILLERKR